MCYNFRPKLFCGVCLYTYNIPFSRHVSFTAWRRYSCTDSRTALCVVLQDSLRSEIFFNDFYPVFCMLSPRYCWAVVPFGGSLRFIYSPIYNHRKTGLARLHQSSHPYFKLLQCVLGPSYCCCFLWPSNNTLPLFLRKSSLWLTSKSSTFHKFWKCLARAHFTRFPSFHAS